MQYYKGIFVLFFLLMTVVFPLSVLANNNSCNSSCNQSCPQEDTEVDCCNNGCCCVCCAPGCCSFNLPKADVTFENNTCESKKIQILYKRFYFFTILKNKSLAANESYNFNYSGVRDKRVIIKGGSPVQKVRNGDTIDINS